MVRHERTIQRALEDTKFKLKSAKRVDETLQERQNVLEWVLGLRVSI